MHKESRCTKKDDGITFDTDRISRGRTKFCGHLSDVSFLKETLGSNENRYKKSLDAARVEKREF